MTREKAIAWFEFLKRGFVNTEYEEYLNLAITALSTEPIRPKGEWLLIGHDDTCNFYKCSFCGYEEHDNFTKHHKFCPNCGAKMKGGE